MFPNSNKINQIRSGVIIKQVSLIYQIKAESQIIELIAFIDNRQNKKNQKNEK